jgi:hypothetical protein
VLSLGACTSSSGAPGSAAGLPVSKIAVRNHEQSAELGRRHQTAADLFEALKKEAGGGARLEWNRMPDWSGIYSRPAVAGFAFDPDTPPGGRPTAKLTAEFEAKMLARIEGVKKGIEWDPISTCAPPGMPRWLTEPFLREFIVTPDQTWLVNEMVNDIRRVYTDGRAHIPETDRYPLYNGDSVGFWDGDRLVIHTNQLQAGIYQRGHPDYTDQVETVEIWHKDDETSLRADVWVYDPPALAEAWYTKQTYKKLDDQDKQLRIRYWNCGENQNNGVHQTPDGTTQFNGFTFGNAPAAPSGDRR